QHDKQVSPDRVREFYADLAAPQKVFVDLACSSHNAMWEKNRLLLFRASLEWLTAGTVNGAKDGMLPLGYSRADRLRSPRCSSLWGPAASSRKTASAASGSAGRACGDSFPAPTSPTTAALHFSAFGMRPLPAATGTGACRHGRTVTRWPSRT